MLDTYRSIFLIVLISISVNVFSQTQEELDKIQFIQSLRKDAKTLKEYKDKVAKAKQACLLSERLGIDSVAIRSNKDLSNIYMDFDKIHEYGAINKKNLKLIEAAKDSASIGGVHWSLGDYYGEILKTDSAYYHYYKALKVFEARHQLLEQGSMLLNMADIQETEKDFIGSERNAIKALKIVEKLPNNPYNIDTMFSLYNILGVVAQRQKNYEEAILYYQKSIDVTPKNKDFYYHHNLATNNIANALEKMERYDEALALYRKILYKSDIKTISPDFYVMLKGNIAHANYLKGNVDVKGIKRDFLEAFKFGEVNNYKTQIMGLSIYISEFYHSLKQNDSAKIFAKRALEIGKIKKSHSHVLQALKLLSKIEEGALGKSYLYAYIQLNDSLLHRERLSRNRFAKIEYETDKLKAENEQISKERLIFLISSVSLVLLFFLIYIVVYQRMKNKELQFIFQQQKANEEIYNLMLGQQNKVEEGRAKEKKRISEELHDGILGKLFGTRLSLDSLNLVNTAEAAKIRSTYINELQNIETEIRRISHDLNADYIADLGFMDIVSSLIENQTKIYGLTFDFEGNKFIDWDALANKTKIHIYRMLQEMLQNIYKHAEASHVKIVFSRKKNVILMSIEDDGKGFNVNRVRKGIGLKNINSRVKAIEGSAEIVSEISKGTRINISIPNL
ncbi:MAG: tetratricopeptide repeat protein [Flavobacteriaceae bacterium]|nr:tetratricopeptide repeat protein [Flavobacteriaceae bacterium]